MILFFFVGILFSLWVFLCLCFVGGGIWGILGMLGILFFLGGNLGNLRNFRYLGFWGGGIWGILGICFFSELGNWYVVL